MIYTLTLNPSLDYRIQTSNFKLHQLNKIKEASYLPGGKGINVSIVLSNLGYTSTAFGFIAGFTGKEIVTCLKQYSINIQFIELKEGFSRINIKMNNNGTETELNGQGPSLSQNDLNLLIQQIYTLTQKDWCILSGSIPSSLSRDTYALLGKILQEKKIPFILDTTKDSLLNALCYNPFLIKPNLSELEELFSVKINTFAKLLFYTKQLQKMGAKNVMISLGKDGAVLLDEYKKIHYQKAPHQDAINPVGAGDSMVAGFLAEYLNTKNYEKALKYSVYCGSASAFSKNLCTKKEVDALLLNQ